MPDPQGPREELSAALAARQELGHEYEPALIDSLAERVERVVEARVEARLASRPGSLPPAGLSPGLRLGSMRLAIPCSAIAGDVEGLAGIVVV